MKKTKLLPLFKQQTLKKMKYNLNIVEPGIKADVKYIEYSGFKYFPYVFDIRFAYENNKQIKSMKQKYKGKHGDEHQYAFYSTDKKKISGVIANSEDALNYLLAKFIESDGIDVIVGNSVIGGKYDGDARKVVEINIAEMKKKYEQNKIQDTGIEK